MAQSIQVSRLKVQSKNESRKSSQRSAFTLLFNETINYHKHENLIKMIQTYKKKDIDLTSNGIRLSEEQILTIKKLALKYFDSNDVRVFGSRADINKKGGDIDIFIKTRKSDEILRKKLDFLREFQKKFGLQKIDLVIEYEGSPNKRIFSEAKTNGVKL